MRTKDTRVMIPQVLVLLFGFSSCAPATELDLGPPPPAEPLPAGREAKATLQIGAETRQTFEAFGFSFTHDDPYLTLAEAEKPLIDRLLFTDLNTRVIRLWHEPGNPARTIRTYRDGGIIAGAQRHGVQEFLLGPGGYTPGNPKGYAAILANDIKNLRDAGVPITATGTQNEPGADYRADIPEDELLPLYLAMRRELDAKGLGDVTLLGPEYANNDAGPKRFFDTLKTDPDAHAAYQAVAHHSYNMAGDPELADRALLAGKSYWQTEAGGGRHDGSAAFLYDFAATASARFLNDLNNGVTHWLWFIGLGQGDQDVKQKLVMLGDGGVYKNFTYHHLQQISRGFPPGTELRRVTSDLADPDMVWSHGVKPPLHAAAGKRADGRFAIAIVNGTRNDGKEGAFGFEAGQRFNVRLRLPADVHGGPFTLCRTGPGVIMACGETVEPIEGGLDIELAPMELVTLLGAVVPSP